MRPEVEGSALMIVRVRLSAPPAPDLEPRLIATITTTTDLATKEETRSTAGSRAEIVALVEGWLEEFVRGSPR